MSILIHTAFESETVGLEPTGAGDLASGTWTVSPANSCLIALDPLASSTLDLGQVLHVGAAGVGTRQALYTFTATQTGLVTGEVRLMRATASGNDQFQIFARDAAVTHYAGFKFA